MKTCFLLLSSICFFNFNQLHSQLLKKQTLLFKPVFGNSSLYVDSLFYSINDKDSIQFMTLKWYISGIELLNDNKSIWKEDNSFHLLNAGDPGTLHMDLTIPTNFTFNQIRFNLGIDSITNVSGALGGDLDPTKGMYWTWQSGYINFKAEGKSNLCQSRNNEFQFHLGGYQAPFNTLQTISFTIHPDQPINIYIDLKLWLSNFDLHQLNHIMSPGSDAMRLSNQLLRCFRA
jgi:hypothetical protein